MRATYSFGSVGKWLLDNIFGVQVPPPPANVDTTLPEIRPGTVPPAIRERLAQHRSNPACASCHAVIDPPGFALEHFDAIGRWRTIDEAGKPVDATGTTATGETIERALGAGQGGARSGRQDFVAATEKAPLFGGAGQTALEGVE